MRNGSILSGLALATTITVQIASAQERSDRRSVVGDHDRLRQSGVEMSVTQLNFSGTAKSGAPVHEWIETSVGTPLNYPIAYAVEVSGAVKDIPFSDVNGFALWAQPAVNESASTESHWDPYAVIPEPGADGNAPGDLNSGCTVASFGFPPRIAQIRYEWRWHQSDTNNGAIDSDDEYGWVLITYEVSFAAEVDELEPC